MEVANYPKMKGNSHFPLPWLWEEEKTTTGPTTVPLRIEELPFYKLALPELGSLVSWWISILFNGLRFPIFFVKNNLDVYTWISWRLSENLFFFEDLQLNVNTHTHNWYPSTKVRVLGTTLLLGCFKNGFSGLELQRWFVEGLLDRGKVGWKWLVHLQLQWWSAWQDWVGCWVIGWVVGFDCWWKFFAASLREDGGDGDIMIS